MEYVSNTIQPSVVGEHLAGARPAASKAGAESTESIPICSTCHALGDTTVAEGIRDYEYGAPGVYRWLRCNRCGMVRLAPLPSDEVLALAYPADYHGYAEPASRLAAWYVGKRRRARAKALANLLPPGGTILDVGCGTGSLLAEVGRCGSFNLLGVEYQPEAAETARRRGATVWIGELEECTISERSVDLVVMEHVLEHVADPVANLRRVRSLLTTDGLLLGETPNLCCPDAWLFGRYWGGGHAPRHLCLFTPPVLGNMLKLGGFNHVELSHAVHPSHMALSIQNRLRRSRSDTLGLVKGRSWYYPLLCSALMPAAILAATLRCSGVMRFLARTHDIG